jgi:hypothetical protein
VHGSVELREVSRTEPLASMGAPGCPMLPATGLDLLIADVGGAWVSDGATSVLQLLFDQSSLPLAPISIISHDPQNADTAYGLYSDLLTAVCGDGHAGLGRL